MTLQAYNKVKLELPKQKHYKELREYVKKEKEKVLFH